MNYLLITYSDFGDFQWPNILVLKIHTWPKKIASMAYFVPYYLWIPKTPKVCQQKKKYGNALLGQFSPD